MVGASLQVYEIEEKMREVLEWYHELHEERYQDYEEKQ